MMNPWLILFLLGFCGTIYYMYTKNILSISSIVGGNWDGEIDSQLPGMTLIKPTYMKFVGDDGRFHKYRRNKTGSYDILLTDGRLLSGVDLSRDLRLNGISLPAQVMLSLLTGRSEVYCTINPENSGRAEWSDFNLNDETYLVDLNQRYRRRLTNVLGDSMNPVDGFDYHSRMDEETKSLGKMVRNLGATRYGGYEGGRLSVQPGMMDELEEEQENA